MPLGGEEFIAGPYVTTWNGTSCGIFEGADDGLPQITRTMKEQLIDSTDRWGKTPIDSVHQGEVYYFMGKLLEYPKALPLLSPIGIFGRAMGVPGALKERLSKPLVLTAVEGTTASDAPRTLTAAKAIKAGDYDVVIRFGPVLRTIPIKLLMFPYNTGGPEFGWFTQT